MIAAVVQCAEARRFATTIFSFVSVRRSAVGRDLGYALVADAAVAAGLAAVAQEVVGQHAGHHRLADRHGADADAGIVAALGDDLGVLVGGRHRLARRQDRRGRLDREAHDDRIAVGDAAQDAAGLVGRGNTGPALPGPHLVGILDAGERSRPPSRRRSRRP